MCLVTHFHHTTLLSKLAKLLITLGDIYPLQESIEEQNGYSALLRYLLKTKLFPQTRLETMLRSKMPYTPGYKRIRSQTWVLLLWLLFNPLKSFLISFSIIRPSIPIFPIFFFSFTSLSFLEASYFPASSCFPVTLLSSSGDTSLHYQPN